MRRFIISFFILWMLPLAAISSFGQTSLEIREPSGYAYDQTTFSSRREMLDFIKSLDFDKKPPLKRLQDYYNSEQKITEDKILRKGVDLFLNGKVKSSVKYFYKIQKDYRKCTTEQRNYAAWQIMHYKHFGVVDIYFNGTPSRMDRINTKPNYNYKPEFKYWGNEYSSLFLMSDPKLRSYDPGKLLSIITDPCRYGNDKLLSNKSFTKEFVAAVLYEAFPKDGKLGIDKLDKLGEDHYLFGYKPLKGEGDCGDIELFFNYLDCLHIIARTNWENKSYYGIGLSANELYKKAKTLNPNKKFDLLDYKEGIKNISENDEQCQILLLRSAYYGNPDAMLELQPYIIESIQFLYRDYCGGEGINYKKRDKIGKELYINHIILEEICKIYGISPFSMNQPDGLTKLGAMKDYPYLWKYMGNIAREALFHSVDLISEHKIEERVKKERRSQFWGNLAGVMLQGLATGVNAYIAANYYGSASMNTAVAPQPGYSGSLADAMSQPGYFQREQQRMLQLSMNEVHWAEMQEYDQARDAYQRMGKDLSLNEFRAMQGQAIMDAKNQGNYTAGDYDIISVYGNSEINKTSSQTYGGFKCAYCNGTGQIERNDNAPASFGQSKANKRCNECGKIYDPTVFNHYHVQCGHCGGTGNAK